MEEAMVGIMIPLYDRPEYLQECLESIKQSKDYLPKCIFCMVVDGPKDKKVIQMVKDFNLDNIPIIKYFKPSNVGMWHSIRMGVDLLIDYGCDYLINLDSDAIVKPNWVLKICDLLRRFPNNIASGFKLKGNYNLLETKEDYYVKVNCGGVSLAFTKEVYLEKVRKHLTSNLWDIDLGTEAANKQEVYYVTNPSVVQHIGKEGLHCRTDTYDHADDF